MGSSDETALQAPGRGGLALVLGLLLTTALACGAFVFFLYGQLREAEAAAVRAAARSRDLERSTLALGAKVEGLEKREQGLTQLLDDVGSRQRARDAVVAERSAAFEALGTLLQPLLKRGMAVLHEESDAVDVRLSERALFLEGTARLSFNGARLLRQLASGLTDSQWRVEVFGQGPSMLEGPLPAAAERARLAAERAACVAGFLIHRVGVAEERVSATVSAPVLRRPKGRVPSRLSSIELRLGRPPLDVDRPAAATASTLSRP